MTIIELGGEVVDSSVKVIIRLIKLDEPGEHRANEIVEDERRTSNFVLLIFAIIARILAVDSWNGGGEFK